MSKWEQIAKTTEIVSKGLNDIWDRKLRKDAAVIVGDSWSNFLLDSTNDLKDAQNHIEVGIDQKTNTLACLMDLPDLHPDAAETGKPFATFFMQKLKLKADNIINSTKNPYARELLEQRLSNYRAQTAGNVASFEASVVMDKRHNQAIENVEKLAKATYHNPQIYSQNLESALIGINSLDIDPVHKAKLARKARQEIAEAASNAILLTYPASILNNTNYEWKEDLDLSSLIRLERQAIQVVNYENHKRLSEFNQLAKIHFKNILSRGKGIDGIEDKLSSLPEATVLEFAAKERMHINAYDVLEQVKYAPLSSGTKLVSSLVPSPESENYLEQLGLYEIVAKKIKKQTELAKNDPALFVETLFTEEVDNELPMPEKITKRLALQAQKGIPSYSQKMLTNDEREEFRGMLDSRDANVIKANLDNILKIESAYAPLGHQIVQEILQDKKLPTLTHFYIDANLYNRGNLKNDLARAMATNQAIGEMSTNQQDAILASVEQKTKAWQESILAGNVENAPEVTMMKAGLLELARFYQFNKHMSIQEATDTAVNNLFKASYFAPYKDFTHGQFYIPRVVIDDKEIIELDEKKINYGLQKLRGDIIRHNIPYDKIASFGREFYESENINSREVSDALRSGTFRLSKDKKSIYYVYFDDKGEHPLMKSSEEVLTWNLLDLNEIIVPNSLPHLHPYGAI